MSYQALVLWVVVFCIGVPSAWRNPTAAALVIAKIGGWGWHRITGDSLPVEFYPFTDVFCLAVIVAKHDYICLRPYRSQWHRLQCCFYELSPSDRAVALIFAVMWPLYVAPIHEFYQWWLLWGLVILQFLFASAESLEIFWRRRAMGKGVYPIIDRHLAMIHSPKRLLAMNGGGGSG